MRPVCNRKGAHKVDTYSIKGTGYRNGKESFTIPARCPNLARGAGMYTSFNVSKHAGPGKNPTDIPMCIPDTEVG